MKILCFVFSWKGQYKNALRLERQLSPLVDKLYIINSDDENEPDHWINIGNDCYFSDQFRKALEIAKTEEYDVFWQICADISSNHWNRIIESSKQSKSKFDWGIFAPNVIESFFIPSRTDVFSLGEKYSIVGCTDELCWMIDKEVINDLMKVSHLMEDNKYGWGWDLLCCGLSHLRKSRVIRDYNFTVMHPFSSGYRKEEAEREMIEMFDKCPDDLKEIIYVLKQHPKQLSKLYGTENSFFYYST